MYAILKGSGEVVVGFRVNGLDVYGKTVPQSLHNFVVVLYFSFEREEVVPLLVIFLVDFSEFCDGFGEILEGGEVVRRNVSQFGEADSAEQTGLVDDIVGIRLTTLGTFQFG